MMRRLRSWTSTDRVFLFLDRLATVAILAAAIAVIFAVQPGQTTPAVASGIEDAGAASSGEAAPMIPIETSLKSTARGKPSADLVIVEFSDFECPACGRYARDTYQRIQRELVESGKVRYVFRHFPLERRHPMAFKAAVAVECASAQGRHWDMHDLLFARQDDMSPSALVSHASGLGLDVKTFQSCLVGEMNQHVLTDMAEGKRLGVRSTPTFLIGRIMADDRIKITRKIVGAQPFDAFAAAVGQAAVE